MAMVGVVFGKVRLFGNSDFTLLGSHAVMSDSRNAANTASNIVRELSHEVNVAFAHHRDGTVS